MLLNFPLLVSAESENDLRDDYSVEYLALQSNENKYQIPLVCLSMDDGKIIGELQEDNGWRIRELSRFTNRVEILKRKNWKAPIKIALTSIGAIQTAVGSMMILSGDEEIKKWGIGIAAFGLLEVGIGVGF